MAPTPDDSVPRHLSETELVQCGRLHVICVLLWIGLDAGIMVCVGNKLDCAIVVAD